MLWREPIPLPEPVLRDEQATRSSPFDAYRESHSYVGGHPPRFKLVRKLAKTQQPVWLAKDLMHGREVAIKILQGLGAEAALQAHRAMAPINSQRLVRIFDYLFVEPEQIWVVLEYLPPPFVELTKLDLPEEVLIRETLICELALEVGRALEELSEAGLQHRDLKPQNIFVAVTERRGGDFFPPFEVRVKLIDFGSVAQQYDPDAGTLSTLGMNGRTPGFAPQRINDRSLKDVFGVARTLIRCVLGREQFKSVFVDESNRRESVWPEQENDDEALEQLRSLLMEGSGAVPALADVLVRGAVDNEAKHLGDIDEFMNVFRQLSQDLAQRWLCERQSPLLEQLELANKGLERARRNEEVNERERSLKASEYEAKCVELSEKDARIARLEYQLEKAKRRGAGVEILDTREQVLAPLFDRLLWNAASKVEQDRAIAWVNDHLTADFKHVGTERFECAGIAHRVGLFRHLPTGMEFHLIPGGEFWMGIAESKIVKQLETLLIIEELFSESSIEFQTPRHRRVIRPLLVGRYPVLECEWDVKKESRKPQVKVSWNDSKAWLKEVGGGLRLLSEAEWEYACRAGSQTRFFWGDVVDDRYCWHHENSGRERKSVDVGTRLPNAFGLVDMSGHVLEWCEDNWKADYDTSDIDRKLGPSGYMRVNRGSSYDTMPYLLLCATRFGDEPARLENDLGLRLARDIP